MAATPAKKLSARGARPPPGLREGLERELVGDGRDEDAGAEGRTSPSTGRETGRQRAMAPPITSDEAAKLPEEGLEHRGAASRAPSGGSVLLGERLPQGGLVLVELVDQLGVGRGGTPRAPCP